MVWKGGYPVWIMRGGNWLTTSDYGRVVRCEKLVFLCLCVCLATRRGKGGVLIKYTGNVWLQILIGEVFNTTTIMFYVFVNLKGQPK